MNLFLIKKFISILLMPLSIGLILGLIGFWFLHKNSIKRAKIFFAISLSWIFIISSASFAKLLLAPLENSYPPLTTIPKNVHYILLLGGDRRNRAWEALRLYRKIPNAKIITSGYSPEGTIPDAIRTAKLLESVGVKKNDIIIQSKPKNTKEEAIEIKKRLKDKPFILVTSAYHMPRAMELFHMEKLYPIPAPTDYRSRDKNVFYLFLQGKWLHRTEQAWHEYMGLAWLWLKK
jgi:uncharacterized SAM-binding protein YcdF (DUF218 family)